MQLPDKLKAHIVSIIQSISGESSFRHITPVGGGCINHVFRIDTSHERYLLKWNERSPYGMFTAEAKGLQLLKSAKAIRVPEVLGCAEKSTEHPAYLLLEWMENDAGRMDQVGYQKMLGEQLAEMHRAVVGSENPGYYGLDHDNFIGSNPQWNDWNMGWIDFFRKMRIGKQMTIAMNNGMMTAKRQRLLSKLMDHLEDWIDEEHCRPSLLHGDLWGGNVMAGPGGVPVLIDPAVYFGDREAEIAFTTLFGGFDRDFYQAYQATWPLDPGYQERKSIYNIYHLLNHMNIFGGSYAGQVDQVLQRYVGG